MTSTPRRLSESLTFVSDTSLGSLSNYDGKKAIELDCKTTTLHLHHAFLNIYFPSMHVYDEKRPNFIFYGGREHKVTIFFFFCEARLDIVL